MNEIVHYMACCLWLPSLSVFLRFIHTAVCISASFLLWLSNISLYGWINFIYPFFLTSLLEYNCFTMVC